MLLFITPAERQSLYYAQVQEELNPINIFVGPAIKRPRTIQKNKDFLLQSAHIAIVHAMKRLIDRMINSNK